MKAILTLFLFFPVLCLSQFTDVSHPKKGRIGQFYDAENKAVVSLTENSNVFTLCFYNKVKMDSEKQMICLNIEEDYNEMLNIYNVIAEFFFDEKVYLPNNKYIENNQYRVAIIRSDELIHLEFFDKSLFENNYFVTCNFTHENLKQLFGIN